MLHALLLLSGLAVAVLPAVGAAAVANGVDPKRVRFAKIQEGMTREEVIGVMEREPEQWIGLTFSATGLWPPPPETGPVHLVWYADDKSQLNVYLDTQGRVEGTQWVDPLPRTLLERVLDWLPI